MRYLLPMVAAVLIAGCSVDTPTEADRVGRRAPLEDGSSNGGDGGPEEPYRTIDEIYADLARGPIPGFAGVYRAGGERVILMTDEGDLEVARAYVSEDGDRPYADVDVVRRVQYDFAELYDWKLIVYRMPAAMEVMLSLDIDEVDNRLELGVYREEVDDVRAAVLAAGVPEDALEVRRDDMIVRGTVAEIRDSTEFLLTDVTSDVGPDFPGSPVIVHHAPELDVPPVGGCVELQGPSVVMTSLPGQIGARRITIVEC